jgi:hypothetical protein
MVILLVKNNAKQCLPEKLNALFSGLNDIFLQNIPFFAI